MPKAARAVTEEEALAKESVIEGPAEDMSDVVEQDDSSSEEEPPSSNEEGPDDEGKRNKNRGEGNDENRPVYYKRGRAVGLPKHGKLNPNAGVICLSKIPDGFFEPQMRGYFSQYGRVGNLKLARSKRTGASRGYAFIEFDCPEVAEIVASTMNGYRMFNRTMKCHVMPNDQINPNIWRYANSRWYDLRNKRRKESTKNHQETNKDPETIKESTFNLSLSREKKRNAKLAALGIDYSFTPLQDQATALQEKCKVAAKERTDVSLKAFEEKLQARTEAAKQKLADIDERRNARIAQVKEKAKIVEASAAERREKYLQAKKAKEAAKEQADRKAAENRVDIPLSAVAAAPAKDEPSKEAPAKDEPSKDAPAKEEAAKEEAAKEKKRERPEETAPAAKAPKKAKKGGKQKKKA